MVNSCCVFGCSNSVKNTTNVSFHRFPKVNPRLNEETKELLHQRRQAWFLCLKLDSLSEKQLDTMRVCGKHFFSGKPAPLREKRDPDWQPSVKLGHVQHGLSPASKMKTYRRKLYRESLKQKKIEFEAENIQSIPIESNNIIAEVQNAAGEECEDNTDVGTQTDLTDSLLKRQELDAIERNRELYELRQKVNALAWSDESCLEDNSKCLFFTGLPSVGIIKLLQSKIDDALTSINVGKLNNFQKLLVTLMKLRNNNTFKLLGYRFSTRSHLISICFSKVVVLLEYAFRFVVHWPEREQLRKVMPVSFAKTFGNTVAVIIDCFEINTQRPSNVKAKAQIFSSYKHNYTVKYLIGITPQGHISFISDCYGGRASDKYVTEDSGILDNLIPGDVILADRGFTIHELVSMHYAELKIPSFLRGNKQLHPIEIEQTRKIANVRVHVERIIGNLRNKFKILNGPVAIKFLTNHYENKALMDYIVRACCILNNLCEPIIPLDQPKRKNENIVAMDSNLF